MDGLMNGTFLYMFIYNMKKNINKFNKNVKIWEIM